MTLSPARSLAARSLTARSLPTQWLAAPLLAGVCLAAALSPAWAAPPFETRTYACDRGVRVPVTYVVTSEGSLAVLAVDGGQVTLLSEPAASGARYGWPAGGSGYVWWVRGDRATLYWKTPDAETPILTCAPQ